MFGQNSQVPAPVIALTIIDHSSLNQGRITKDSKILAVVRDSKSNPTHPDVVSTPTQRIPPELHNAITNLSKSSNNNLRFPPQQEAFYFNQNSNGHEAMVYATDSLFCRKLGLADYLELDMVQYKVCLGGIKKGISFHHHGFNEEPEKHHISMINLLVIVSSGVDLFPKKSASYSHILWVEVKRFLKMVEEKNPIQLSKELNPFRYCVHGLCISTANEFLLKTMQ